MDQITINKGSDLHFAGVFRDSVGEPVDMTGWDVSIYDHQLLGGEILIEWSNASVGEYQASMQWVETMPLGSQMKFRLRATKDGEDITSPLIRIIVK
jgi:hypothetical protein